MKECCANPTSDWKNIRFPSNHIRLWNIFMCMCVLYCHRFQEIWLLHGASRRYIFLLWFIFESVWLHAMCTNFRAQFEIIHAFATVLTHQKELLFHDLFCGGSFDMQSSWCSLCCHFVFHLEIHVDCSWCVYHVRSLWSGEWHIKTSTWRPLLLKNKYDRLNICRGLLALVCIFAGRRKWEITSDLVEKVTLETKTQLKFQDEIETSSKTPRLQTWRSRPRLETSKFLHFAEIFWKNFVITSDLNFCKFLSFSPCVLVVSYPQIQQTKNLWIIEILIQYTTSLKYSKSQDLKPSIPRQCLKHSRPRLTKIGFEVRLET